MLVEKRFLLSTHCLIVLIFVPGFMKISQTISELLSGHDFVLKISKEHSSVKNDQLLVHIFNMLYERVDDVLVLIYSIFMWLYLFACIFSKLYLNEAF